jgi:hypothetical protein
LKGLEITVRTVTPMPADAAAHKLPCVGLVTAMRHLMPALFSALTAA